MFSDIENDPRFQQRVMEARPSSNFTIDSSSSVNGAPAATHLPRQVTFGLETSLNALQHDGAVVHRPINSASSDAWLVCLRRHTKWIDASGVCYILIAFFMIGVGIAITTFTIARGRNSKEKQSENEKKEKDAMVWIVGPIFICAGIVVAGKAVSHCYRRANPLAVTDSTNNLGADGHFLSSDTRQSLRGTAVPPSYSDALMSPIPSTVVIESDDKIGDDEHFTNDAGIVIGRDPSRSSIGNVGDQEETRITDNLHTRDDDESSLRYVTLDIQPKPPTYDEALEILARSHPDTPIDEIVSRSRTNSQTILLMRPNQRRFVLESAIQRIRRQNSATESSQDLRHARNNTAHCSVPVGLNRTGALPQNNSSNLPNSLSDSNMLEQDQVDTVMKTRF